jgi:hypothetical protein
MMRVATANIVVPMITVTAIENFIPRFSLFAFIALYPLPQTVKIAVAGGLERLDLRGGQDVPLPEIEEAFPHGVNDPPVGVLRRCKGPVGDVGVRRRS